jgi:hypothetical protein
MEVLAHSDVDMPRMKTVSFRRPRGPVSAQRGQSLVEVALSLPLLLVLLVGIIEVGRFSYYSIVVSNAARAGAQYGAQTLATAADQTGIQNAARGDGGNVIVVTSGQLCRCAPGAALGGCGAGGACANPAVYVWVTAKERVNAMFSYPGFPPHVDLANTVQMRVGQ